MLNTKKFIRLCEDDALYAKMYSLSLPSIFTFSFTVKVLPLRGLNDETWYTDALGFDFMRKTVVKLPLDSFTQVQS